MHSCVGRYALLQSCYHVQSTASHCFPVVAMYVRVARLYCRPFEPARSPVPTRAMHMIATMMTAVHKVEAALQQVSTVLAKAISDHEEANDKLEGMVSARDQLKTDAKLATGRSGPSQKSIDEGWGASLEEAQKHVRGLKASFEIAQKKLGKVVGADPGRARPILCVVVCCVLTFYRRCVIVIMAPC